MTAYTRQPATVARTAEHYYELRAAGIVTIGATSRARLEAWARSHGFAPAFVDERPARMRVGGEL